MPRVIAALCALMLLAGCSSTPASSVAPPQSTTPPSMESSSSEESTSVSASSQASTASIGSRKNAAPIGTTLSLAETDVAEFEITLMEIKRGDEALKIVMECNSMNDPPADGNEYILATFKFKNVKDISSNDTPFSISEYDFSFADSSFAKKDNTTFCVIPNSLTGELYEGAETTGNVLFECKKDDKPYAVFCDTFWFRLFDE